MKFQLLLILFLSAATGHTQLPDTLVVHSEDSTYAFAIWHQPVQESAQHTKIAKYQFDTSAVAVELDYKNGKPCGRYKAYFPNGQLMVYAVYGWGFLHGDWTEYDEWGKIILKGFYQNGQRHGLWAFKQEGVLGKYKKGKKHGKWRYFHGSELVRFERYRKGQLVVKNK